LVATARLTPLTTGRDNRGTSRSLPEDTAASVVTPVAAAVPRPANLIPQAQRALVILCDGLTPTLHWAHAFLCAISCLIGGDGLIGRIGAARLPRGYPRGNDQTIKTPGGGCDGKIRHREPTGAQAPAHRALGRGCAGGHCHIHPCRSGIRLVDGGVALSGSAVRLTPFTTGRDNRSSPVIQHTAAETGPRAVVVPRPAVPGRFSRALVYLRDGLTPFTTGRDSWGAY